MSNTEPVKVTKPEYFLKAGEQMATLWGHIAADDEFAAAWLHGDFRLVVDRSGVTIERVKGQVPIEDHEYPGQYL